jgi:hypothetical protein
MHGRKIIGDFKGTQLPQVLHLLEGMASIANGRLRIEIHSLLRHDPSQIAGAISNLINKDFYFFIHDFYSICPSMKLLRNGHTFCGGPQETSISCQVCSFGSVRQQHQSRIRELIEIPDMQVISPSLSAKEVWLSSTGSTKQVKVLPHISLKSKATRNLKLGRKLKIAYVGHTVEEKGWTDFLLLMNEFQWKFNFYVFTTADPKISGCTFIPLINRAGKINHTRDVLMESQIDFVFMFPRWPETFSLVTTEAISAGAFILTNKSSGNIGYLTNEYRSGAIFEDIDGLFTYLNNDSNFPKTATIYEAELSGLCTGVSTGDIA